MDLKEKIITLDNNEKYIVVNSINYVNRQFLLLDKIINEDELAEKFEIAELIDNKVKILKNEALKSELEKVFKSNMM